MRKLKRSVYFFQMKERTSRKFGTVAIETKFGAIESISLHTAPVSWSRIFYLAVALSLCTLGSKAGPNTEFVHPARGAEERTYGSFRGGPAS